MTPKAIGNRIKAKGLQKLRWYCQMCQKQCRDENGMKCHMASEGHLRMMRVFSESSGRIISDYSEAFLNGYLKTLSHRHGTKRISANRVYQEYIGDKDHIHMNATAWSSLSALCKYLGKEGKCIVEETEKGI
jgi:DNA/RNA-binding protein KIN17